MSRKTSFKKKQVTDTFCEVSPCDLEVTFNDLQNMVSGWITKYGPTARLDWDANFQYNYDPFPSPRFTIKCDRIETDEELNKRVEIEAEQQRLREEKDRAEFERLSKLFSKK